MLASVFKNHSDRSVYIMTVRAVYSLLRNVIWTHISVVKLLQFYFMWFIDIHCMNPIFQQHRILTVVHRYLQCQLFLLHDWSPHSFVITPGSCFVWSDMFAVPVTKPCSNITVNCTSCLCNTHTTMLFSMPEKKDLVCPNMKYVKCSMPKIPGCSTISGHILQHESQHAFSG